MSASPLTVRDARIDAVADGVRVSARFGDGTVSWELPADAPLEQRGEPLALTGLMVAMRGGVPLVLPAGWPLDPQFRAQLDQLQEIWRCWYPGLSRVAVESEIAVRTTRVHGRAAGFSGGVDSTFTVAALQQQLDSIVFIDGIDAKQRDEALMQRIAAAHRVTANDLGVEFRRVTTDVKTYSNGAGISWTIFHGAAIASVAHLLGVAQYYIAGSNSWENLRPMGSHPLTDPLLGSSTTTIIHHGADARRVEKVRALGGHQWLLDRLRVCLQGTDWNCGRCAKCLQTAAELRVAQLHSAALPPLTDPRGLRQTRVSSDGDLVDWAELLDAELWQRDPALAGELRRLMRRYRGRRLLRELEEYLLGGAGKQLLRRVGMASDHHRPTG